MSLLKFDKAQLGNLEYSLQREMLSTNRAGGYMSTTIVCCNTRKYHGLMVGPVEGQDDDRNFVLLSTLDETVIQHDQSFNLAIHRFPGAYEPRGHKYITDFEYTPTPTITYRVGGVVLKKEMLWIHSRMQLMIRYTLIEAKSPTKLRLRPFLAFRDAHTVGRANMFADGHSYPVDKGIKCRLYEGFPWLNMQTANNAEFIAAPDWYYNFEYLEEQSRGYPFQEDLLTPGYFEMEITKGESVIFSACTGECADNIEKSFNEELAKRSDKIDFLSCMRHSARQFVVRRGGKTEVVAGYPWFGRWGRDTFIALPGITLTQGNVQACRDVVDTLVSEMQDGLFPNMGSAYNSVDAPMWFFFVLQQLEKHIGAEEVWKAYGKPMKDVLEAYRRGIGQYVALHTNGLVWASNPTLAMTWMDAVVDGKPVTGRDGYQVEINALWYNAVCYTLELAEKFKDAKFVKEWKQLPAQIKESFVSKFWHESEESYLADYVNDNGQNTFRRPNQVIACSLPYKMIEQDKIAQVLEVVKLHLLTPKGLRTLSPQNPLYQGRYGGDQPTRDRQYHQGTVWPWPLEHYVSACFQLYGKAFLHTAEEILAGFDEDITMYGIGSIAEIYDGDPPHAPKGAPSQAWSVGAILRINEMIGEYGAMETGGKKPATAKTPAKPASKAVVKEAKATPAAKKQAAKKADTKVSEKVAKKAPAKSK